MSIGFHYSRERIRKEGVREGRSADSCRILENERKEEVLEDWSIDYGHISDPPR